MSFHWKKNLFVEQLLPREDWFLCEFRNLNDFLNSETVAQRSQMGEHCTSSPYKSELLFIKEEKWTSVHKRRKKKKKQSLQLPLLSQKAS